MARTTGWSGRPSRKRRRTRRGLKVSRGEFHHLLSLRDPDTGAVSGPPRELNSIGH
ncbi:MAG: hypothetical protein J2P31_14620 [Blastocatellia bacterium]|nr:hypothetical protein [Blastocatellia bacterium]